MLELGGDVQLDRDSVRAALEPAAARDGDRDSLPGIHLKAAALLEALVRIRPFPAGNERIALIATVVFLNLNGWDLEAEPDELALLVRMISQGRLPLFDIAAGLESATIRLAVEG